jgi:hypothetical protein
MSELRDFVYLDDESLNSNLSSLGQGIPSEIVHSTEGEKEKGGEAGGGIMGFSLGGKYSSIDRDAVETTMSITAPYRFQDFLEILDERGIEIYENPDPRSLARGDVVRIQGSARPMSLFKFEVAIKTIRNILNAETRDSLEELDEGMEDVEADDLEQLSVVERLIEQFTGEQIPLRLETEDWKFGVPLERNNMRVNPPSAFIDEPEYKIVGRVEQRVVGDSTWDPIQATSIMKRYLPENEAAEELRNDLEEVATELSIPTEPDDWELNGHTAIIHPIAVFW